MDPTPADASVDDHRAAAEAFLAETDETHPPDIEDEDEVPEEEDT